VTGFLRIALAPDYLRAHLNQRARRGKIKKALIAKIHVVKRPALFYRFPAGNWQLIFFRPLPHGLPPVPWIAPLAVRNLSQGPVDSEIPNPLFSRLSVLLPTTLHPA
jgi:hypothetical protein